VCPANKNGLLQKHLRANQKKISSAANNRHLLPVSLENIRISKK
jgi:hypothetical protein